MIFATNRKPAALEVDPYAQLVTAQAVDFLYRVIYRVSHLLNLMPIGMVMVMWATKSHVLLLFWCAIVILVNEARFLTCRVYMRTPLVEGDAARWGRYYTWYALADSLLWGGAVLLFYVADSTFHQVFIYSIIMGMTAGSIGTNSYWIASYYAYNVPMVSVIVLRLMMIGGAENYILAALFVMMLIIFIMIAQNSRKSILNAIRLRFENVDLIERLREEKEKAEAASRDKTRFLASASHDLRQPVHALALFADALYPEVPGERGKVLLGNVGHSIDALNQLLESLLDISKLDANIVKPNPEHFELHPLMETLQAEYLPQAHAKGLLWKLELAEEIVVHSDPVLLGTMLRNLISNAIRYTNSGSVAIACKCSGDEVKIDVRDTGIGIPLDQQIQIFREFYQLTNPERDRSKGLGLGLAIVERLALLLHHRIELESESGKGSCFAIVLERGDRAAVMTQEDPHPYKGNRDVFGMKLVVIDDEQAVREGMRAVLENWGCEVILAASDDEAVAKLGDNPPHVIVADYRLRETRTGAQAIERLRKVFGSEIPALIITGDTGPERLREAQDSGHTLMHKPVQPAKLRAYLRSVQRRKA